jgi:Domain of unknown function (DUF4349)
MKIITIISLFILLCNLSACYTSRSKYADYDEYTVRGGHDFSSDEIESEELSSDIQLAGMVPSNSQDKYQNSVDERGTLPVVKKVIFNGYMTLLVKNIDSTSSQLEAIAKKYEGYASEIGTYKTTIRVKSTLVKEAMNDIADLGYLQNRQLSGNDVTNEYLDFQIRLDNAEKARVRYLELLEKAENVEAALKVERELERLNGTIDMLKGNMNRINHLSDFTTITVHINEKKKPGILGYIGIGIYRSVKWLFVRN